MAATTPAAAAAAAATTAYTYEQLFTTYPTLDPFYFEFEKYYDPNPIHEAMIECKYSVPIAAVALYLLFCYYGQSYMRERPAYDLSWQLAVWNLLLSMFSFYGTSRTVPHLLYRIATRTIEETVCDDAEISYGHGACGLATFLFIVSKIPELFDTLFIVLRKKPLIFLHWYHHVTVLLYCWNAYVTQSSAGLWFIAMNYSVHAVMYFYYCLQALRFLPRWFPSWVITTMQILQMIIGTVIVGLSLYYFFFGGAIYSPGQCNNAVSNLVVGFVIYASYLYLFVEFAVRRYLFTADTSSSNRKEEKPGKSLPYDRSLNV